LKSEEVTPKQEKSFMNIHGDRLFAKERNDLEEHSLFDSGSLSAIAPVTEGFQTVVDTESPLPMGQTSNIVTSATTPCIEKGTEMKNQQNIIPLHLQQKKRSRSEGGGQNISEKKNKESAPQDLQPEEILPNDFHMDIRLLKITKILSCVLCNQFIGRKILIANCGHTVCETCVSSRVKIWLTQNSPSDDSLLCIRGCLVPILTCGKANENAIDPSILVNFNGDNIPYIDKVSLSITRNNATSNLLVEEILSALTS
jgi:hypothetical protein